MEKPNFQRETEKAIERLCVVSRPPLLLHACCAPCSSYVLEYLTQYFSITLFFCNPNITDPAEYQKRLAELRRFCAEAPFCRDVTVVEDSISSEAFLRAAAGLEDAPEGGSRCERCFRLRLERAAAYAQEKGFPLFATTLTVSPIKTLRCSMPLGRSWAGGMGWNTCPLILRKREAISGPSRFRGNMVCTASPTAGVNFPAGTGGTLTAGRPAAGKGCPERSAGRP